MIETVKMMERNYEGVQSYWKGGATRKLIQKDKRL